MFVDIKSYTIRGKNENKSQKHPYKHTFFTNCTKKRPFAEQRNEKVRIFAAV